MQFTANSTFVTQCLPNFQFYILKEILPVMKARAKGNIVLMGSDQSIVGKGKSSVYGLTKGAIGQLTKSTAIDYADYNIRVNCIAPSLTKSKIAEPMLKNTTIAEGIAKAHPLKRLGEGKDSAALAKFLITEESSWITGQVIAVDGGRSKLS